MKHLPKHLRSRYRYLAVVFSAEADFDRGAFQDALWEESRALFGDAGSAAIDPSLIRFEGEDGDGTAIVRARRGETTQARAALACIHAIEEVEIGLRIVGTSGTVRACEEKYISDGPVANE